MARLLIALVVFLAAHAGLGWRLHKDRPELGVFPPLPKGQASGALSFGDPQFLYRTLVLQVQNAGDSGGRAMPMRQYNMLEVLSWLRFLQSLDHESIYYVALATHYFSQQRSEDDLRALISFVDQDVRLAPQRKWYWQTQAIALARDRLKDIDFALALSAPLKDWGDYVPDPYLWVVQVEPILLADLGRIADARRLMDAVVSRYGQRMDIFQRNWTQSFYDRLNEAAKGPYQMTK